MIILPTPDADLRTKNRIRENGPRFRIRKCGQPQCFGGRPGVFCISKSTGWSGWLKSEMINVKDK